MAWPKTLATAPDYWFPITEMPVEPVQVELFFGDWSEEGLSFCMTPYRDARREMAFWDGEVFRNVVDGEPVSDESTPQEEKPTHWCVLRPLPAHLFRRLPPPPPPPPPSTMPQWERRATNEALRKIMLQAEAGMEKCSNSKKDKALGRHFAKLSKYAQGAIDVLTEIK